MHGNATRLELVSQAGYLTSFRKTSGATMGDPLPAASRLFAKAGSSGFGFYTILRFHSPFVEAWIYTGLTHLPPLGRPEVRRVLAQCYGPGLQVT